MTQLVLLYKSHVLGFVEYRTAAVYHASPSVLAPLNKLQDWFLRDLGVTAEEALEHFGLAPLTCRRDMAMLGVVFRALLGKGGESSLLGINISFARSAAAVLAGGLVLRDTK